MVLEVSVHYGRKGILEQNSSQHGRQEAENSNRKKPGKI
jgi:hypothetical protein